MDRETVRVSTFKKWLFSSDFSYEHEDNRVTKSTCKYCSDLPFKACVRYFLFFHQMIALQKL